MDLDNCQLILLLAESDHLDPMEVYGPASYGSEYYGENSQRMKNKPGSDSSFEYDDHSGTLSLCMMNFSHIINDFFKGKILTMLEDVSTNKILPRKNSLKKRISPTRMMMTISLSLIQEVLFTYIYLKRSFSLHLMTFRKGS